MKAPIRLQTLNLLEHFWLSIQEVTLGYCERKTW